MYDIIVCTIFITTGNLCWWVLVLIKNGCLLGYTLGPDLKVMCASFWGCALHRKPNILSFWGPKDLQFIL